MQANIKTKRTRVRNRMWVSDSLKLRGTPRHLRGVRLRPIRIPYPYEKIADLSAVFDKPTVFRAPPGTESATNE